MRRLAVLVLLIASPSAAQADVVYTLPCPFGARERTSHAGPRCTAWTCATDADCDRGLVCRSWRVCVQTHDVPIAGRGAFRDPPPPPRREELVVATCPPDASCSGDETPRPPVRGQPVGEVRCAVAPHCVRPPLPSIPGAPPPRDEGTTGRTEAPPSPLVGAPATGSACGCRAASPTSTSPALALIGVALVRLTRRRW